MMTLRLLIIDDEELARARARRLLSHIEGVDIIGEADSGLKGLALIEELSPDAVLLDIEMPDLDGLRLHSALDDPPAVIYSTAYDSHAIRAFELDATDYLLKPYSAERLRKAIEKVRRQHSISACEKPTPQPARISVDDGAGAAFINTADILMARIEEGVVFILTCDGEKYSCQGTLQDLEGLLPHQEFIRINRQAIVALSAIRKYTANEDGSLALELSSGAMETVSRRRAFHLKEMLDV